MEKDVPLAPMTWFRLGGRARFLFQPLDRDDLSAFCLLARQEEVPVRVLGAGANVLIPDQGFPGVVIRLDQPAFKNQGMPQVATPGDSAGAINLIDADAGRAAEACDAAVADEVLIELGAGVSLMPLCRELSERGFSGIEGLAGIPATIGGAVKMNAGGRHGDMADVVRSVTVLTTDGSVETRTARQLAFSYRHSAIQDEIVLSATLGLRPCRPDESRKKYEAYFRQKEQAQPFKDKSAGCIFKNPASEPAGALIDRLGLKERRLGGAMVSPVHANFIVTDRGASAADVIGLIDLIRDEVLSASGTLLQTEVDIW
ncbi:MAG: UDP-N-acetylmuramate dehydrogenase [Phycisphaerae bacterium]